MLSPIPRSILRSSATFSVPTSVDRYQTPTVMTYTVNNVHIQADNSTLKTGQNTEVKLKGIIFIDERYSSPKYHYEQLQESAQAAGGVMTVTITDRRGKTSQPFTVVNVDALPDDEDNIHHWELSVT